MFISTLIFILSHKSITTFLSIQIVFFSSVISLFQAIKVSAFSTLLFFLFNSYTFFNFLDIINYIYNYLIDL